MSRLPHEILFLIFSYSPILDLVDLARLSMVSRTFRHVAITVAEQHPHCTLLLDTLGFVPANVLSMSSWVNVIGPTTIQGFSDCFASTQDLTVSDIVQSADLFSRFLRWLYRFYQGFPALASASLSDSSLDLPFSQVSQETQQAHKLFLFSSVMVYAAIRGLNRRVRHVFGKEKEAAEYSHLDHEQREQRLLFEFKCLRTCLLRCDPLQAHVDRILATYHASLNPTNVQQPTLHPLSCQCACYDRGWACWYLSAWHHLVARYRRFMGPDEISFMSYRTILNAVPSFPPSVTWIANQGSTRNATPTESLLLTSHLNPDSMLFSLRDSKTSQQTKSLYNLSEHTLAPGMARLWASNVGYAWGEGGALWLDEHRNIAERRLSVRTGRSLANTASSLPTCQTFDSLDDTLTISPAKPTLTEPIQVVLLAHARWRARRLQCFLQVKVLECTEQQSSLVNSDRYASVKEMLDKSRSFDVHFTRRALQIQQWAGFDSNLLSSVTNWRRRQSEASTGGSSAGADSSRQRRENETVETFASPPHPLRIHPSSPFLVFDRTSKKPVSSREIERMEKAAWKSILAPLMGLLPKKFDFDQLDPSSSEQQQQQQQHQNKESSWPFSSSCSALDTSKPIRDFALSFLDSLHEGLIYPEYLELVGLSRDCQPLNCIAALPQCDPLQPNEKMQTLVPPCIECGQTSTISSSLDDSLRPEPTHIFLSDNQPPGAPDVQTGMLFPSHSFSNLSAAAADDDDDPFYDPMTALWPKPVVSSNSIWQKLTAQTSHPNLARPFSSLLFYFRTGNDTSQEIETLLWPRVWTMTTVLVCIAAVILVFWK